MPHNIHPSIRWLKSSPWLESEVLSLDEKLELLEKLRGKRAAKKGGKKVADIIDNSHDSRANEKRDNMEKFERGPCLQVQKHVSHPMDENSNKNSETMTSVRLPAQKKKNYHWLSLDTSDERVGRKVKGNMAKRRRSSGLQAQGLTNRCTSISRLMSVPGPTARKKRLNGTFLWSHAMHYEAPIGCRWSQNSCAYDVVFTSMFVLWCSDRPYWTENLKGMGNTVADLLLRGFSRYEKGEASLEDARDNARRLIARSANGLPFGHNTSIENVSVHLFTTNKVMFERYYVCPNGHHDRHSDDCVAVLSSGVHEYGSIVQWVSEETHHAEARCQICRHAVNIKLRFQHGPPLLVFSMAGSRTHINPSFDITSIDTCISTYTLLAVIYYADQHFTAQVVTRDGRIWYYDGLALINPNSQPTLEEAGSIHCQPNLQSCRGCQATAAIYYRLY